MVIAYFRNFYERNERWIPIAFFLLGFLFDVVMLRRIDELNVLVQQAAYMVISAFLIGVELVAETREVTAPRWLTRVWRYREALLHFLLGTLLNSYAIFYFKSASAFTSLLFIGILVTLLTLNEFKRFGNSQTQVHSAFLSLCLISYLVSLAPTLMGFIGKIPFLVATLGSIGVFSVYYRIMQPRLIGRPKMLKSHLLYPYIAIQSLFVVLYFSHAIPPVPLSVKYMGIFHDVQKTEDGEYELYYSRPIWKFWQHGDQTFLARPGDSIFCYVQIFSPTRFKDQLQVRWFYYDERRGWLPSDAIPLTVLGGREEGFRAMTKKNNYQPGLWRVRVETMDEQEVGRINVKIVADETTGERYFHQEIR